MNGLHRAQPGARLGSAKRKLAAALGQRSDVWTDLALTMPVFVGYHLGVIALPVRNAADFVTWRLTALANHSLPLYLGITVGLGAVIVGALLLLGQRRALSWKRFAGVMLEGALYAVIMRAVASYVVGSLRLGAGAPDYGPFAGTVMSLGAGFYEELAFRVILFGLGLRLIHLLWRKHVVAVGIGWAVLTAALFSAWHYVGPFGDTLQASSFVFRWVYGLAFVAIYRLRGFAPAVWTHALYDIWVLAL